MSNGKAARPSGLISVVKPAVKAEIDIITDLINQINVEGVILAEWEFRTTVKCVSEKEMLQREIKGKL